MCLLPLWRGHGRNPCFYVDDILKFGTTFKVLDDIKTFLSQFFEMKDIGETNININTMLLRNENNGITLVESHYVKHVFSIFGYSNFEASPTLYDFSVLLQKNQMVLGNAVISKKNPTHTQDLSW